MIGLILKKNTIYVVFWTQDYFLPTCTVADITKWNNWKFGKND